MSRTTFELNFSNFTKAENNIKQLLLVNGFKQTIVNSETIWKKGGTLLGGQCLKFSFSENRVVLSAWITPFLNGDEEYNLDGFGAIIPKKQLLSVIEQIKIAIQ